MRLPPAFRWIQVVIIGGGGSALGSTSTVAAGFAIPEASALLGTAGRQSRREGSIHLQPSRHGVPRPDECRLGGPL